MIGTIIRNTGSWYTVKTDDGRLFECKVKGTFRLKGMVGDEFDIRVSREIASRLGLDYTLYLAEEPDEELRGHLGRLLGDTRKWDGTFETVYRRELGGRCKLNGSLADQIGKALMEARVLAYDHGMRVEKTDYKTWLKHIRNDVKL